MSARLAPLSALLLAGIDGEGTVWEAAGEVATGLGHAEIADSDRSIARAALAVCLAEGWLSMRRRGGWNSRDETDLTADVALEDLTRPEAWEIPTLDDGPWLLTLTAEGDRILRVLLQGKSSDNA